MLTRFNWIWGRAYLEVSMGTKTAFPSAVSWITQSVPLTVSGCGRGYRKSDETSAGKEPSLGITNWTSCCVPGHSRCTVMGSGWPLSRNPKVRERTTKGSEALRW